MPLVFVKAYDRRSPTKGGHKPKHELKPYVKTHLRGRMDKETKKRSYAKRIKFAKALRLPTDTPIKKIREIYNSLPELKQKSANRRLNMGNMSLSERKGFLQSEKLNYTMKFNQHGYEIREYHTHGHGKPFVVYRDHKKDKTFATYKDAYAYVPDSSK